MDLGEPFFSDPELSGGTRNDQCKKTTANLGTYPLVHWYPMRTFTGYFGTSHYNSPQKPGRMPWPYGGASSGDGSIDGFFPR